MYKGTIIKESISDENILCEIAIEKVEIWKAVNHDANQPLFWTAIQFTASEDGFPEYLAKALLPQWYVDMTDGRYKFIIFKDHVFRYQPGDAAEKQKIVDYCREVGVPESQIDWPES